MTKKRGKGVGLVRFIHCADLHLDSSMTTHFDEKKGSERQNELLLTFLRMVDFAVDEDVDGILICGDLFDGNKISQKAIQTVYQAVVSHPEIVFFYLKGNHDEDGFTERIPDLPENLKLFGKHWKYYQMGGVMIAGIELQGQQSRHAYEELQLPSDLINLVLMHGQEVAYATEGQEEVVVLRDLRGKGIDYLALGHVHAYKESQLDARGVYCYSGCLEGRGFDECGEHGFVLLEIEEQLGQVKREFIPFASRYLYEYSVDVSECTNSAEIMERMTERLTREDCDETSLVKVKLVGEMELEGEKDLALIEKQFENQYYFFKLVDETSFQLRAEDFAFDASLRGEFVRAVMSREDLTEEEKTRVVRYGIKALAGEVMD